MIFMIFVSIISYLIGSVPSGYLFTKIFTKTDIRTVGSGNVGATNALRAGGKKIGIAVLIADICKGVFAVAFIPHLMMRLTGFGALREMMLLSGLWVILGHNYTIFLGFKGGKGIATTAGVLLVLCPWVLLVGLLSWVAVFVASRYVSLASIAASIIIPCAAFFYRFDSTMILFLTFLSLLSIYRHKSNIVRLLRGEERSFRSKK